MYENQKRNQPKSYFYFDIFHIWRSVKGTFGRSSTRKIKTSACIYDLLPTKQAPDSMFLGSARDTVRSDCPVYATGCKDHWWRSEGDGDGSAGPSTGATRGGFDGNADFLLPSAVHHQPASLPLRVSLYPTHTQNILSLRRQMFEEPRLIKKTKK